MPNKPYKWSAWVAIRRGGGDDEKWADTHTLAAAPQAAQAIAAIRDTAHPELARLHPVLEIARVTVSLDVMPPCPCGEAVPDWEAAGWYVGGRAYQHTRSPVGPFSQSTEAERD